MESWFSSVGGYSVIMSYTIIVVTYLLKSIFYVTDFTFILYHLLTSLILEVRSGQRKKYKRTFKEEFLIV